MSISSTTTEGRDDPQNKDLSVPVQPAGTMSVAPPEILSFLGDNWEPRGVEVKWHSFSPETLSFLGGDWERVTILTRVPNFFVLTAAPSGRRWREGAVPEVSRQKEPTTTRSRPNVSPGQSNRQGQADRSVAPFSKLSIWLERMLVLLGLALSCFAHAYNMFNYPRYELDEGTYISSAWAILNGMITPYPYGYGHPPLAWMQIALWVQLTGGFFTFGNANNTGRVLMLLFALGCALLVYLLAREITHHRSVGLLAMMLFTLSPISLTYQRQVFLDNVGTFWLLLSLYLLIRSKSQLSSLMWSALSFGCAFLSKEVFLLFMPALIYTAWLHSSRYQRKFTIITFTYTLVACGMLFILMAVLKGELFPYSWHLPGDNHQHLSMLDTLVQQIQRGQQQGKFSDAWYEWTRLDRPLLGIGFVAIGFNLLVGLWNYRHLLIALLPVKFQKRWRVHHTVRTQDRYLPLSLLALSFWLLLIRGGVVLPFYILPMLPFLALNIAAAVSLIVSAMGKLTRLKLLCPFVMCLILAMVVPSKLQEAQQVFILHPTSAQRDAMFWVRNNVPRSAMIVINSYLYTDLQVAGGQGVGDGGTYPYAHVYWNVAYDPNLHDLLLQNNWDRIDYVVADSEMLHDIKSAGGPMSLINEALQHSILRAQFRAKDSENDIVISVYQVVHKQGRPTLTQAPSGIPMALTYHWTKRFSG